MPITQENVTIKDWNNAQKLGCPYLRYICGVFLALNEIPCRKHNECNGCRPSGDNVIIVQEEKENQRCYVPMSENKLKAYFWKPTEDDDYGLAIIAENFKEARKLGWSAWGQEEGNDAEYIE